MRTALQSGQYAPGDRFTEESLCRDFVVSRTTIREALGALVNEGHLERIQGRGTFVRDVGQKRILRPKVAIVLRAQAHLYETETRLLVKALQRRGAIPLVFDTDEFADSIEKRDEMLADLLHQGVAGAVMEPDLVDALTGIAETGKLALPRMAIIIRGNEPLVRGATYVLTDFNHGGRIGTEHLIRLGHQRILFAIHRYEYLRPGQQLEDVPSEYGQVLRGYLGAMRDAGLERGAQCFFLEHELLEGQEERQRLREVLRGPDRPTAVFAYGDIRAKRVMDIADEAGLKVPGDLAVIGYWNTPWVEMTQVPLTSVSIREDEIARLAVESLFAGDKQVESPAAMMMVKPEMVIRESCGTM